MLTSIRVSDNIKVIGNLIDKDNQAEYSCEYCKHKVIHHKSDTGIKIGHFKHKNGGSHCPNQSRETDYHIRTKLDIHSYIEENWGEKLKVLEVEKWLCNNTLRADIYIETSKTKIAIEVQATILTVDEINKRTERYTKNGIYVLWVLPFLYERFMEYRVIKNYYNGEKPTFGYAPSYKVKMKEMEIFLYWSNYKKLIFWDLEHEYSDSFICIGLNEYKTDNVEFYRDGEEHHYYGKTTKTLKSVEWIKYDIEFNQLKPSNCKEFIVPRREYIIPARKIMTYYYQKANK